MFGLDFRKKHFSLLDPEVVSVNHGSFGLTPDSVYEAYVEAVKSDALYPERQIRLTMFEDYVKGLKLVGEFINADYRSLAIMTNASYALNTVLRSIPFGKGDKVVHIEDLTYKAVENTIEFVSESRGIEVIKLKLACPISDDDLVEAFEKCFKEEKPKMAVFDTISSMPGVRVPFERLIELCRKYDVLSLVDGAHGIGILPLDLTKLKPDYFLSNLHKWLYVPRGSAVLYVDPKHFRTIQTAPISRSFVPASKALNAEEVSNLLVQKFLLTGTSIFALLSAIESAFTFRKEVCGGEEKIWNYCHGLALEVGEKLLKKWGTSVLENAERTLTTTMVNIALPDTVLTGEEFTKNVDEINVKVLDQMMLDDKTYVPLVALGNKVYCRLSAQIYNEYSDYEQATDILFQRLKEYKGRLS